MSDPIGMSDPVTMVMLAGGCVLLLVLLSVWLAARADYAVPRLARVETLDDRIADKKADVAALDAEIAARRQAIDAADRTAAEAAALERRLDELRVEWDQMADRRAEVERLGRQTEEAQIGLAQAEGRVADARSELDGLQLDLEEARRLEGQVETLASRRDGLAAEVERLREEVADAEGLRRDAAALAERVAAGTAEVARLEGLVAAREEAEAEARAAREAALRARAEAEAAAAAAREEARDAQVQLDALAEKVREAERKAARLDWLDAQIADREAGLRSGATGAAADEDGPGEAIEETMSMPPALVSLDAMAEARAEEEEEAALERVRRHLTAIGLHYPNRVVRAFHTSMKVNDTAQMTVLAGISGTGKSQLPRRYAEGMGIGFLSVPVQPRWDSPQDLMGFYNYIERRFRPTDMARALYHMDATRADPSPVSDRMLMVLLDEMNLARVEYYFSDFLSRLEGRPERERVGNPGERKDSELELELRRTGQGSDAVRIFPGYNLLFAGTMNEDESTQTLSDKVIDRANVLRFAAPRGIGESTSRAPRPELPGALPRARWDGWRRAPAGADVDAPLERMVELMTKLGRPFGYRLQTAIRAYVANYPTGQRPFGSNDAALADQVEMRLLPKLRGVDLEQTEGAFGRLEGFVRDGLGDEALADAIRGSVNEAGAGSGLFAWLGVTR